MIDYYHSNTTTIQIIKPLFLRIIYKKMYLPEFI